MPRIYKGNDTTLRLLIHTCTYEGTISDLKISLYTNDPSIAIEFTDRYTIDGNIVSLDVPNWAFGSMEDGVINYVAQGMIGDDTFLTNRQSNYYLKTPTNFTPTPMPEDVVLGELTTMIVENGVFEYTPTDVDAWNKATIEVNVPSEGGSCNLGEGEIYLTTNDAGFYELYAADDGYDGWSKFYVTLENGGAIKIHKAEELIQYFNEGGHIDFGAYYYVGGKITDIQEISTEWGNATYTLDNGFKVYRGKWMDDNTFSDENQIKVGAYIAVYGIIQDYKGQLQFKANSQVIAYQECEGGEIVSCNIQNQKRVDLNGEWEVFRPDEGYDGVYEFVVDAGKKAEEWREEGRNDIRNQLQSIEITENGIYDVNEQIYVESLRYNGGYHTDTISTYDINRIEVTFKADTSASINGQGQPFILGGSMWGLNESGEDNECARAIQYAYGRIVGYWEGKWTDAVSCMDGEWITIILDENGMTVKYPTYERYIEYTHDNGNRNSGSEIFPFIIGGQGRRKSLEDGNYSANLIEDTQFRGIIKEVKINTNSMGEITYIPKDWGYGVWDRKVENTGEYLSALEPTEGEVTMNGEWERKYGEGWKEINVNVDGEESVAANARVLDITENGVYTSEYTQDGDIVINSNQQITGVYDDGTNLYDTAELFCSYVQLDVIPTEETRIEFWYLPNKPHMGDGFHRILQSKNEQISFVFGGGGVNNTSINLKFGNKSVDYTPTKSFGTEWLHIIVDRNGATVNDVEMPFDSQATFSKTEVDLCINGGSDMRLVGRLANGTYGMVKIGDTTYIPYEGGFLNTNSDVLQPIIQPNLGVLEDGTPITKATYLNGAVFDTGLKITEDSTIELWINKYSRGESGYYLYSDLFSVRRDANRWYVNTTSLYGADSYRNYFEHITISKAGGFVVECEGTRTMSLDSINFSSGNDTIKIRTDNANFAYGLLKINGNIIVPSEDGFTNITTNTPLRRCEEWGGTFEYKDAFSTYYANEITIQREDTLIRTVNVNIVPKIKVADEKFSFRGAQFTKIPEWADIDGIENMSEFLFSCSKLTEIRWFDASRTTNMTSAFMYCSAIVSFPPLNTIRVATMNNMLDACTNLVSVPPLDARSRNNTTGIFGSWTLNKLTDFGGLIGLKTSMNGTDSFNRTPNLTYESCINILNGLYDFTGNGITPDSNQGILKVHSNFLTTVGDEIAIATNKGWQITA